MGSSNSYTDGLRVKIGEKYKPPHKINLPLTYAQRLNLNKSLLEQLPGYEFGLERSVAGKMREWRDFRLAAQNERRERLQRLLDDLKSKNGDLVAESAAEEAANGQNSILLPTQAKETILQPIPLQKTAELKNLQKNVDKSPFNISDFENDTSSPFDNMELKSMNDMEELARVLQDKKYEPGASYANFAQGQQYFQSAVNSVPQYAPPQQNGYFSNYYYYNKPSSAFASASAAPAAQKTPDPYKNVPDVVRQLQDELKSMKVVEKADSKAGMEGKLKAVAEQQSDVDLVPDLDGLPKNLQDMCRSISSMGFPLARVVRICQLLGDDHKKIVDHLLVLSELLDLGFQEKAISQALLQCNNDKDKALDILIS